MVKCGVLFEVETEFLNIIDMNFGFLASSQYASGRSCDRPSRHRFSWFSSVFKQMLRWFPNSKFLLHASHAALPILNSSKLPPVVDADDLTIRNSKFRCLSVCHHNVFISTLFLPEGRAGVAWEHSNKKDAFFLSLSASIMSELGVVIKCSGTLINFSHSHCFTFHLYLLHNRMP
jgi:hypothetical protein